VVHTQAPLVISDARQHPLVCDNLAIGALGVVAYLGVPLTTPEGHVMGSFCTIDNKPRRWTQNDFALLQRLAAPTMSEIATRLHLHHRQQAEAKLQQAHDELEKRVQKRTAELAATNMALRREIADRQQAEAQLRQSEARYRSVVEGALEGMVIHRDGIIQYINSAAVRMFGYDSPHELLGRHFWNTLFMSEALEVIEPRMAMLLQGRDLPVHDDWAGKRKDGSRIWLTSTGSVIAWGDQSAILSLFTDVSSRKQHQEALRRAEHFALLGRLSASVAHDIRNPLHTIFLHMDLLEEELQSRRFDHGAQIAESLADVRTELNHIHDLVQDYLSLARVSTLQREPVDLGAVLQELAQAIQEQVTCQDIAVDAKGLAALGRVSLHINTFRRVLHNLVHNAVEAMPHGGTLTIRGRRTASDVYLTLRDTGTGIPPDQLPQVFEPLHTTKPKGTGLGLYIARHIVEAHDGHIEAQSQPGQGTTFTITLPGLPGENA
jgi:two-component system sporulation sensor kinase A